MAQSYRLFSCARCRRQTKICTHCDCGQRYCSQACSAASRSQKIREARQRYQRTERGRLNHKVHQQRYLMRCDEKMMDQGPPTPANGLPVRIRPTTTLLRQPVGRVEVHYAIRNTFPPTSDKTQTLVLPPCAIPTRCDFCGRPCGDFARRSPLRRRGSGSKRRHPRPPGSHRLDL